MIRVTWVRDFVADRQIGAGELGFSLTGHCEERQVAAGEWDLIEIQPLSFFRRKRGQRYRIATPGIIVSTYR